MACLCLSVIWPVFFPFSFSLLTRGLDLRLIHLQILFPINALQKKKIIVTLLTVSWAADGVLQACHVELVMTQLFFVFSTVETHKTLNEVNKLVPPLPKTVPSHFPIIEKKTNAQVSLLFSAYSSHIYVRNPNYNHLFLIKSN